MRNFLVFSVLLLVVGCSSSEQTGVIEARCAEPPPVAVTERAGEILRLDTVRFGERFRQEPATSGALGMNLDGRCSTNDETTHVCTRVPGSSRGDHADGEDGIDNSFGRALLPMLSLLDERPSEASSGTSFLVFEGGGRATLHVGGRSGQILVSVPLASVRLQDDRLDALVTLSAVIPPAEFRESLSARANNLMEPPNTEICSGSTLDTILDAIDRAADVRLDLVPNRAEQCNGISIGLRFRATAVKEMPKLSPTCDEQLANEADGGGG